jgi:hypothetical protein
MAHTNESKQDMTPTQTAIGAEETFSILGEKMEFATEPNRAY